MEDVVLEDAAEDAQQHRRRRAQLELVGGEAARRGGRHRHLLQPQLDAAQQLLHRAGRLQLRGRGGVRHHLERVEAELERHVEGRAAVQRERERRRAPRRHERREGRLQPRDERLLALAALQRRLLQRAAAHQLEQHRHRLAHVAPRVVVALRHGGRRLLRGVGVGVGVGGGRRRGGTAPTSRTALGLAQQPPLVGLDARELRLKRGDVGGAQQLGRAAQQPAEERLDEVKEEGAPRRLARRRRQRAVERRAEQQRLLVATRAAGLPHRRRARQREGAAEPREAARAEAAPLRQRRVDGVLDAVGLLPRARQARQQRRRPPLAARPRRQAAKARLQQPRALRAEQLDGGGRQQRRAVAPSSVERRRLVLLRASRRALQREQRPKELGARRRHRLRPVAPRVLGARRLARGAAQRLGPWAQARVGRHPKQQARGVHELLLPCRLKDERRTRARARRHQPRQAGVEALQQPRAARQARQPALLQRLAGLVGGALEASPEPTRRPADDAARARARRALVDLGSRAPLRRRRSTRIGAARLAACAVVVANAGERLSHCNARAAGVDGRCPAGQREGEQPESRRRDARLVVREQPEEAEAGAAAPPEGAVREGRQPRQQEQQRAQRRDALRRILAVEGV